MIIKLSVLLFFISNKCMELVVEKLEKHPCFSFIYIYKYAHQYHLVEQFTSLNLQTYLGLNMITVEGSRREKKEKDEDKKKMTKKRQNSNKRYQIKIH